MSRKSIFKAIGSISLAAVMLLETATLAGAQTLAERLNYTDESNVSDILFDTYYYSEYLKDNALGAAEAFESEIDVLSYVAGNPQIRDDAEKGKVVYTDFNNRDVTYNVTVPQDGLYEIYIDYYCIDGNSQDVSRGIKIDGSHPFEEAKNIFFKRSFLDANKPKTNNLGDEVMPSQEEVKRWKTTAVCDNAGMYGEPLKFALTAGQHTIAFEYINQPVLFSKIVIKSAKDLPSYKEIKSDYKAKGYKNAKKSLIF